MTRDTFAQFKDQWLTQVLGDPAMPSSAKVVATCIALHLNRETGDAFPGAERMAKVCSLPRSSVFKMVNCLKDAGHLEVTSGGGRCHSNRYRPLLKSSAPNANAEQNRPNPRTVSGSQTVCNSGRFTGTKPCGIPDLNRPEYRTLTSKVTSDQVRCAIERADPPGPILDRRKTSDTQGTRIAPDWRLSPVDREYAASNGFDASEIECELEKFRDYWLAEAGPKAIKRDWHAAWRTWVRKALELLKRNGTGAEPKVKPILWRQMVEAYSQRQFWPPNNGPKPDEPGCRAPAEVLEEFGYRLRGPPH